MSWAAATALIGTDQTTSSTLNTYGNDSSTISLNPGESCVIYLKGTTHSSTASDLLFRVLTSPDGGTTFDTQPYMSGSIAHPAANSTLASRTFVIFGVKTFKVQLAVSVSSAAWSLCNGTYLKDGISA